MRIKRQAKDTLTPLELDVDDEVLFTLPDGQTRHIVVTGAAAHVNRRGIVANGSEGVLSYRITCTLEIDGARVDLVRSIPSQENFRPPARVMGLRIWLDAVDDLFEFLEPRQLEYARNKHIRPRRRLRFAVWDERARICPVLLHPWCPLPEGGLQPEHCYRGEDTWLGPYDGTNAHGGLDINMPAGTPLWTPLHIDKHELFDKVTKGANNNRWRGWRQWPNGSIWMLHVGHLIRVLVPENQSIPAGTHYADAAGVHVDVHEHSHFVFGVQDEGEEQILLDPWLLFWQMYEDRRETTADMTSTSS